VIWLLRIAVLLLSLAVVPVVGLIGVVLHDDRDLGGLVSALLREKRPGDLRYRDLVPAPYEPAVYVGELEYWRLDEVSGLARSMRGADVLWALNDSDNPPELYAIGFDAGHRGAVRISGGSNEDWEDLASFEHDGVPYLLIGEIGDNLSWKKTRTLVAIEEPNLSEDFGEDVEVDVAASTEFRYEDGPRDVEGMAVDPVSRNVVFVSKRDVPARVYVLPLHELLSPSEEGTPAIARFVAELDTIPQPDRRDLNADRRFGRWRSQPTSLDISHDGQALLVMTYRYGYLYRRQGDAPLSAAFARPPERVALPPMKGGEAIAFGAAPGPIWVSSERRPAPLYRLDPVR